MGSAALVMVAQRLSLHLPRRKSLQALKRMSRRHSEGSNPSAFRDERAIETLRERARSSIETLRERLRPRLSLRLRERHPPRVSTEREREREREEETGR